MSVINFGGILTNVRVPDRNGVLDDVVLGFDDLASYLADHGCMGDTVGRYGNRIAAGALYARRRDLSARRCNNGGNHLHGGSVGFSQNDVGDADPVEAAVNGDLLRHALRQPRRRGASFPGTLDVTVTYGWDEHLQSLHSLRGDD